MRDRTREGRRPGSNGRAVCGAGAVVLATMVAIGCGGEEVAAPKPSGRAMGAAPAAKQGNAAPVIESVSLEPKAPRPGQRVKAVVRASDPDGDAVMLHYAWRVGGSALPESTPEIDLPAMDKGGRIEVTVTAKDDALESESVRATANVGNQPPDLIGIALEPAGEITRGRRVVAVPRATDPDGDALTYTYAWTVNGIEQREDGDALETANLHRGDSVRVRVVASDGDLESKPIESPPMPVANAAPHIVSKPPGFDGDGSFRYAVESEDADGDRSLRYRLAQGPEGMTLDALSGAVAWKPTAAAAGSHTVEIEVQDLQGGKSSQIFTLNVGVKQPEQRAEAPAAKPAPDEDEESEASGGAAAKQDDDE